MEVIDAEEVAEATGNNEITPERLELQEEVKENTPRRGVESESQEVYLLKCLPIHYILQEPV